MGGAGGTQAKQPAGGLVWGGDAVDDVRVAAAATRAARLACACATLAAHHAPLHQHTHQHTPAHTTTHQHQHTPSDAHPSPPRPPALCPCSKKFGEVPLLHAVSHLQPPPVGRQPGLPFAAQPDLGALSLEDGGELGSHLKLPRQQAADGRWVGGGSAGVGC